MKKPENPDESGKKLIESIASMMDLPRLTASVRNDGKDETVPVAKKPSHRSL
jgi:hypothetical protein